MEVSRRYANSSYRTKWDTELEHKVDFLVNKYAEVLTPEEHAALTGVKWKDIDLQDVETNNIEANVVVIGEIQPPLSEEELEVIAMDPKFCMESTITKESIQISLWYE